MPTAAALSSDAALVRDFLEASMAPDPEQAATFMADGVVITFTGGRVFAHPSETTAFNARRYKWVKKRMERFDVAPVDGGTVVYSVGTLYGMWPDGEPFEGNRYVDRYLVRDGKIVTMDVWNDSAERILTRCGIEA
jgi:ketosteroid isomerase-like protein